MDTKEGFKGVKAHTYSYLNDRDKPPHPNATLSDSIPTALTYDDVLLVPKYSTVRSRKDVDITTQLTPTIPLKIPIISGNMESVTESKMAITMARLGGIGILHRFLTIHDQAEEVRKVKRAEAVMIENPYTLTRNHTILDAKNLMRDKNITGILITDQLGMLHGILTNRDIMFTENDYTPIDECMTPKKDLITEHPGIDLEHAKELLRHHRIEKLPLIDDNGRLVGLITAKDLLRKHHYPDATTDKKGRLMVGAAIGVKPDDIERAEALLNAECDVLLVDIAHAHSETTITMIKNLRKHFGNISIIAGNVATPQATEDLIKAGADAVKAGIGAGRICVTRIVAGAGYPQFSAVLECSRIGHQYNIPIIADSGLRGQPGNFAKAIAAGASVCMKSASLAGTDESPGIVLLRNGRKYKIYRGSASFGANMARNQRLGNDVDIDYHPEGVEALVPYTGSAAEIIKESLAGLRSGMSYTGAHTIKSFWENAEFVRQTPSGINESHPHDVEDIK